MACPASPEPDGFHRYKLASEGTEFATACVHCGAPKVLRPFAAEDETHLYRRPVAHRSAASDRTLRVL